MRLGSGIAPVRQYRKAGVPVGIGVDGSASNDGSHLLNEARMAMMLARVGAAPSSPDQEPRELMSAREALEIATLGGAQVLGRTDVGSLSEGKCADFVAIDLNRIEYAGGLHDPLAAAFFCSPVMVDHSFVHGQVVVQDRQLMGVELGELIERQNAAAQRLVDGN